MVSCPPRHPQTTHTPMHAMLEHATGQPCDGVIAHRAHGTVSRPRPRMEKLGRKGGGGRRGGRREGGAGRRGESVRTHPCIAPALHPPLLTHLLPYVSGCSSSDVFTPACSRLGPTPDRMSRDTCYGGQSSADEAGRRARVPCEVGLHGWPPSWMCRAPAPRPRIH